MELFDTVPFYGRPLAKPASTRNAIGDVAQIYVSRVLGVEILPIDGRKTICPDFLNGEIKSVGKNGRALIYKWRLEKEATHFDPSAFFYVFVRHKCPVTLEHSREVVNYFKEQPPTLIIASLQEVLDITSELPLKKFSMFNADPTDTSIGYNRKGYADGGWQFALSKFVIDTTTFRQFNWSGVGVGVNIKMTRSGAGLLAKDFFLV